MVLHMLHDLSECLAIVHKFGQVHRDLKPGNALLMLHSQCWRLIDFGIAAEIGMYTPCSARAQ
jgi:serine/threonine protein kinase